MMRILFLFFGLLAAYTGACAQFLIDGRKMLYDSRTNTYLVAARPAVSGSAFTCNVTMEHGWHSLSIEGNGVGDSYTFTGAEGGKRFPFSVTDSLNRVVSAALAFTSLPVIHLSGAFGYDYQPAVFTLYDTGVQTLEAVAKWRGGSTNTPDKHKRNYKIKFGADHSFFGLRSDNGWILDAGQADLFRVRNRVATELWNDMARRPYYAGEEPGALTGVRGRMVEVFLNDEYAGIYCFTECMDRKQLKLRKYEKVTGAVRGGLWKSGGYGSSLMWSVGGGYDNTSGTWDVFEVKYPELDDVDTTDYSTLYNAISFVANSSDADFESQVSDYFDLPVVLDYYILLCVLNAADNIGKNMYWAVYDKKKDKKLTLAVWDLDCTAGQRWVEHYLPGASSPGYNLGINLNLLERLIRLDVGRFSDSVIARYRELRRSVLSADSLSARYRAYFEAMRASGADSREEERWSGDSDIGGAVLDLRAEADYIHDWFARHIDYLDNHRFTDSFFSGITSARVTAAPSVYHNMNGQRVSSPRKGVYIYRGRKYVVN